MSARNASWSDGFKESREMAALRSTSHSDILLQSTTFNSIRTERSVTVSAAAIAEREEQLQTSIQQQDASFKAPTSCAAPVLTCVNDREDTNSLSPSTTSVDTEYSTDMDEHRDLQQSPTSRSQHEHYDSFLDEICSDSEQSYSTLEDEQHSCLSLSTTDWEESSDDDAHLNLIQPPDLNNSNQLAFWNYDSRSCSSSLEDYESSIYPTQFARQRSRNKQIVEERYEFCVQCNAWPEVTDCTDPPRRFYDGCHHTRLDPLECAFGCSVYLVTKSLSLAADETQAAADNRKAVETVLKSQFNLLIQQFAVDPDKVARTLYGISVIDMNDLEIATTHMLPKQDRAKVLTVTLVRRLRRWPNLFQEVCKVLSDIPAMQEANAKVRQLLFEECTEDQYTEILEKTQQQRHQSPEDDALLERNYSDPAEQNHQIDNLADNTSSTAGSHDIADDSVSYSSRFSKTSEPLQDHADPDVVTNKCTHTSSRANVRLHESCLENRSVRSLDALISTDEVDINSRDKNGRTPLIVACLCLPTENPNARIVVKQRQKIKSLLAKGADGTIQDYDGNTALHIATLRRDKEVVKMLLDRAYTQHYFNIAITNKNSRTALHYACYWGEMELVMPLLELEKEMQTGLLNVRDRNGDTGLHIASRGGFKAVVKELLKANANKEIQNQDGKTAADVATEAKHTGIAKLLRRKKTRWFSRKKANSDHVDSAPGKDRMHRSSSNASLLSNHSDNVFSLSGESDLEESDTEFDVEL